MDHSNAQKRWLFTEGYGLVMKLYEDSSVANLKEQIKVGLGDKGHMGKYRSAGFQSKTKVIFPELLHIDAITHTDDFFEWAGQKETIVIFDAHCTGEFAELPIPVQIPEIRWRDRYENAIKLQKETKKSKKGVKEVHGEEEPEEDAEYKCRACGRKVEEDLVKLHRKKCPAYKAKGLDEIEVSDDEDDDAAGANGINPELERILKGKERKLGTDSEEESDSGANSRDDDGDDAIAPSDNDLGG